MWIFTRLGFISVVQKEGETMLTVRSRARADLDNIRKQYMPELGPTRKTSTTDYPYRALIGRNAFVTGMSRVIHDLTYSNYKNEVAKTRGMDIERVYAQVWSVLKRNEDVLDGTSKAKRG